MDRLKVPEDYGIGTQPFMSTEKSILGKSVRAFEFTNCISIAHRDGCIIEREVWLTLDDAENFAYELIALVEKIRRRKDG